MELSERLFETLKASRGVEELSGTLKIPHDIEVELYLNAGTNFVPVAKVTEVKVDKGLWTIRDLKGDTLYFASERVVGLKVNDSEKRRKEGERSAGFTRNL